MALGRIGLQLGVGYSVSYLVYTIGTLITNPASLNVGAAIVGLIIVLLMVVVVAGLINKTNQNLKAEYTLNSEKN